MEDQAQNAGSPVTLITSLRLRSGVENEFSSWHAKMATVAAGRAGFISAGVNAPSPPSGWEWNVLQHFRSASELRAWRATEEHRRLIEEARSLVDPADAQALREDEVAEAGVDGAVTEVVTARVRRGKERQYQDWAERIHRAEAQFPGYRGGYLQPPASNSQHYWTTLVRFATPAQLEAWLNSSQRRELLGEHNALVESWEHHRMPTSFAAWFPTDTAGGESPPNWKQSMLVVLMLFPIVATELRYLHPLLGGFNAAEGTFIGNVISVALLAWPFMPIAIAAMRWWLFPRKDGGKWINPTGVALLIALYGVEIALLSRLL